MRLTVLSFCLAMTLLSVGGCGIKPPKVDSPAGVEKDSFPKTYPAADVRP